MLLILSLFVACGEEEFQDTDLQGVATSTEDNNSEYRVEKVMKIDEPYSIKKTQTISKTSDTAQLILEIDTLSGETVATLKDGGAEILSIVP